MDFLSPQSPLPPPEPPIQQMAQARVRRIFGVPITPRRGRTFAAGLAQGLQGIQPGGGFNNFLQGFSGGLGGALRGGEVFDESQRRTHEDERQQIAQSNDNQRLLAEQERLRLAQSENVRQWGEYNAKMNPAPTATEDIGVVPYGTMGPLGPGQIMAPQGVPKVGLEDYGKTFARKTAEAQFPDASAASADAIPPMDEDTVNMLALGYLRNGQTPMWARSKEGARTWSRVLKRAANPPAGGFQNVPDIGLNTAQFGADKSTLQAQQKLYDAATSWENTVGANAEVALKLLPKIPDWGNQPMNWVARNLALKMGSPEMAAFNTARETVKVEYARLLQSPGVGNSVLSDTARLEVEKILSGNQTVKQFVHSLNVLRKDAHNRRAAYGAKIQEIRSRIGGQPGTFPDLTGGQSGDPLDSFYGN